LENDVKENELNQDKQKEKEKEKDICNLNGNQKQLVNGHQ